MIGTVLRLIKRTAALLAAGAVVFYSGICLHVRAETDQSSGYWSRTKVEVEGPNSQFDGSTMSGGHGTYHCSATCVGDVWAYHNGEDLTSCAGEHIEIDITVEEPPEKLIPGEELALRVSPSLSASQPHDSLLFYACYVNASFGGAYSDNFYDGNGAKYLGFDRTWEYDDYYGAAGQGNHLFMIESDNILRATVPDGSSGELWIGVYFAHGRGEDAINTYYYYEYVDPSSTDAAVVTEQTTTETTVWIEQTVNKDAESSKGTDAGAVIDTEIITGKKDKDGASTAAKAAAGAVGAAVVGGAAASAISSKKKKNNVIYKMIVSKDFGDTLYPGEHYTVYAQIVQMNTATGQTRNADELSSKIEAFSEQLPVKYHYNSALNMIAAEFDVNEDNGDTAVLAFRLQGKGGVFTENVKFKVENPEKRIEILYINSDGSIGEILDQNSGTKTHGLFLGENLCSTVYLAVYGYYQAPSVSAVCETSDLAPTVTFLDRFAYSPTMLEFMRRYERYAYLINCKFYKVELGNRTAKPASIFGNYPLHTKVHFTAKSKRGAVASYVFPVALIPRGFFVDLSRADKSQKSDEYIELYTNELVNENRSELKATPLPIYYGFLFTGEYRQFYGYNPNNRKIGVERIIFDNASTGESYQPRTAAAEKIKLKKDFVFDTVKTSSYSDIAETGYTDWEYGWCRDKRRYHDSIPVFRPKIPVLQENETEELLYDLDVCYETRNDDANSLMYAFDVHDTGTVPVRVYGEPVESPLHERHQELAKLDKIIKILDLEKTDSVKLLNERSKEIATGDIHRVRRWMFDYGVQHQEFIFNEEMAKAEAFGEKIVYLTSVKWILDTIFATALKIYCKDKPMLENVISILKPYIEEYVAQCSVAYYWDEPYPSLLDAERFLKLTDDAVSSMILNDADKADSKKLIRLLVLASLSSAVKTIAIEYKNEAELREKGKTPEVSLWWRLISGTMKDMTMKTLNVAISRYLLKSDPKYMKEHIFNGIVSNLPATGDIVDSVFELARDKQILNGKEPYDVVLEKMAAEYGTVELTLADGTKVTVSKMKAVLMYTDKYLEQWGIAKLKQLFEQPLVLPEKQPYIGRAETEQLLGQHGFDTTSIHWS